MAIPNFELGDVVFTCDSHGVMHSVITGAQRAGSAFRGGIAKAVHASIVIDNTGTVPIVAEAVGSGIRAQALQSGNYRVYRSSDSALAENAAFCAEGCISIRSLGTAAANYGCYKTGAAALSPFRVKQRSNGGRRPTHESSLFDNETTTFFCSNFVFKAYASAASILSRPNVQIKHARSQIGPRDLMIAMESDPSWTYVGQHYQP